MFDNYPDVITVEDLQKILRNNNKNKVSKKTIYKMIKNKEIKARKVGKLWFISKQNLIDYFQ